MMILSGFMKGAASTAADMESEAALAKGARGVMNAEHDEASDKARAEEIFIASYLMYR